MTRKRAAATLHQRASVASRRSNSGARVGGIAQACTSAAGEASLPARPRHWRAAAPLSATT
eukprot:2045259-Alexandrium_andersonii.AAC.1